MRYFFAVLIGLAALAAPTQESRAEDVNIGGFVIPGSIASTLFYDYEKLLIKESDGALDPNLLIHGEGGPEEQILTGIRRGRIHVASLSTLVLSNIVPELGYLGAPFLYESKEQFDHVVDTQYFKIFSPLLAERDLTILRWLDLGGQNIYARKPILWPKDAVGVRLRATQDLAARLFLESVGADVIYITSPETIPGLQTGLIDGGVTPTVAYAGTGLVPDAPHYTLTRHFYLGGFLLANKSWLEGLPSDQRRIVIDSFASNSEVRAVIKKMITTALSSADEQNFTAHELTPEQRQAWRAATIGTHPNIIDGIGGRTQEIADALAQGRASYLATHP